MLSSRPAEDSKKRELQKTEGKWRKKQQGHVFRKKASESKKWEDRNRQDGWKKKKICRLNFSTGVSWHETCMPLVSSNMFLCWCTHDSRTGGLHIHSHKHNLWCYACGSCPRIFRILCSLTQPVTGILSKVAVVGLVLFNPLWHSLETQVCTYPGISGSVINLENITSRRKLHLRPGRVCREED